MPHEATFTTEQGQTNYTGWWFEPLGKILVNWDDYSIWENKKCSKPPTS